MEKYSVLIKPSAVKELEAINKRDLRRITNRILSLSENPRPQGAEKLSDNDKYRVRQGNYRIVYSVEDNNRTVLIVKVGHRREVYR